MNTLIGSGVVFCVLALVRLVDYLLHHQLLSAQF